MINENDAKKIGIKELLESKRPNIRSEIGSDSLPDLLFSSGSVKHAAESELEERLCRFALHSLILSFSMNNMCETELPDDIKNLVRQRNVESDLRNIY